MIVRLRSDGSEVPSQTTFRIESEVTLTTPSTLAAAEQPVRMGGLTDLVDALRVGAEGSRRLLLDERRVATARVTAASPSRRAADT